MFCGDDIALALKNGKRDRSWGLNLNVFPMEVEDLRKPYLEWREKAERIMKGTGAYVLPFEHIHVTASSPAPFRHHGHRMWTEVEKKSFAQAWIEALRDNSSTFNDWPKRPFPLVLEKLVLHSSCAVVLLEDPTDSVSKIRECVARCLQHPLLATERMAELVSESGFKTPNIIHCTVMRLTGNYTQDFDTEIEERWARAAAEWTRTVVTARSMTLVEEIVAYQHFQQSEGLLAEFPYA